MAESENILPNSRVCARCALSVKGGKLQADMVMSHIPLIRNNTYTTQPNPEQPVPSMDICIEQGLYANANTSRNITRIGMLQVGGGDCSPAALQEFNRFLDDTQEYQLDTFGERLPPMYMGGPLHLPRHPSFCIYTMSVPDPGVRDQQNERDRRHNTLTEAQRTPPDAVAAAKPPPPTRPLTITDRTANAPFEDDDMQVPQTPHAELRPPPTKLPHTTDQDITNNDIIGAIFADDLTKHAKARKAQVDAQRWTSHEATSSWSP